MMNVQANFSAADTARGSVAEAKHHDRNANDFEPPFEQRFEDCCRDDADADRVRRQPRQDLNSHSQQAEESVEEVEDALVGDDLTVASVDPEVLSELGGMDDALYQQMLHHNRQIDPLALRQILSASSGSGVAEQSARALVQGDGAEKNAAPMSAALSNQPLQPVPSLDPLSVAAQPKQGDAAEKSVQLASQNRSHAANFGGANAQAHLANSNKEAVVEHSTELNIQVPKIRNGEARGGLSTSGSAEQVKAAAQMSLPAPVANSSISARSDALPSAQFAAARDGLSTSGSAEQVKAAAQMSPPAPVANSSMSARSDALPSAQFAAARDGLSTSGSAEQVKAAAQMSLPAPVANSSMSARSDALPSAQFAAARDGLSSQLGASSGSADDSQKADSNGSSLMQTSQQVKMDAAAMHKAENIRIFIQRIDSAMDALRQETNNVVQLRLNLAQGEVVKLRLSLRGAKLKTLVQTDNEQTRSALRAAWPEVSKALAGKGIDAQDFEFEQFSGDGRREGQAFSGRDRGLPLSALTGDLGRSELAARPGDASASAREPSGASQFFSRIA
jgi:hypothetical protein